MGAGDLSRIVDWGGPFWKIVRTAPRVDRQSEIRGSDHGRGEENGSSSPTSQARLSRSEISVAVTRNNAGSNCWNASEILGSGIAAGISNVYYPAEDRTAGKTASKRGQQIAVDAVLNVMKEFWPDVRRKLFRRERE